MIKIDNIEYVPALPIVEEKLRTRYHSSLQEAIRHPGAIVTTKCGLSLKRINNVVLFTINNFAAYIMI